MSVESRQFVDTNVVVYAYDDRHRAKRKRANELIAELGSKGRLAVSIQVLQETYVTLTQKPTPPLTSEEALTTVRRFATFPTHCPTAADVVDAIELSVASRISFWDAMLIHSASVLHCDVLWTEDLSSGQTIAGVQIRNPFQG